MPKRNGQTFSGLTGRTSGLPKSELTVHFCHATQSLQFRGLRFCSDEDRNVGVGIFPESKEILIRGAALGSVALHRIGASQLKVGQRTNGFVEHNSAMVEDFLKLGCCFVAAMCSKIGLSSHIDRI